MENICKRYHVLGKVQGVWFRDSTLKKAQKLNITGWVRNLSDGSVEVLACGEEEKLNQLFKWLHKGPILAKVDSVNTENIPFQKFSEFVVQ